MGNAIGIQCNLDARGKNRAVGGNSERVRTVKRLSIGDWYRILRVHHQWSIFQAIRYSLWLLR